jgi:flagellin
MAISLSSGVRQALSSLQSTAAQQSTVQNRLATGKKVNSALDNPTSFFTASGLNNRASDLGRLLDDMGQAVKTLQAADKAITAITKLVESAQSIAKQAQASAAVTHNITGSAAAAATSTVAASDQIDFSVGGVTTGKSVTLAAGDKAQNIVDKVNAADIGIKASIDSAGKVSFEALGGESLAVLTSTSDHVETDLAITGSNTETTHGASTTDATRKSLAAQFDGILSQIDQLSKDAGYNGVNLLGGDSLKVTFNEKGTSSLTIKGTTFDSAGLGISASKNSFQADSNIQAAISALSAATTSLRTQASTFGANLSTVQNRQDFTKGMIDTLQQGADLLTNADSNEEGANLLALNTRAQLSQTALSLASQQEQAVLRLF